MLFHLLISNLILHLKLYVNSRTSDTQSQQKWWQWSQECHWKHGATVLTHQQRLTASVAQATVLSRRALSPPSSFRRLRGNKKHVYTWKELLHRSGWGSYVVPFLASVTLSPFFLTYSTPAFGDTVVKNGYSKKACRCNSKSIEAPRADRTRTYVIYGGKA